jgi:hypothetical protein
MPDQETDTRYGHRSGSGSNEPKRHERKEQDPDWRSRQGGDETGSSDPGPRAEQPRPHEDRLSEDDRSQGKGTRGHDEIATRRHLEGSEQGPM